MATKTDIEPVTNAAEELIRAIASAAVTEEHWVTHYGANDIHPRHLVFWICVESDAERDRLRSDAALMERIRNTLDVVDYPEEGKAGVHFGFESQETVDRESGGNWWHHWK